MLSEINGAESYVNCWHINDHESSALWRLYSTNDAGICLKTKIGKLKECLEGSESDIYIGKVDYIDYDTDSISGGSLLTPIFKKRKSFQHERELRVCFSESPKWHEGEDQSGGLIKIMDRNPPGMLIPCKIDELVEEVVVSPLSPDWFADVVEGIIHRFDVNIAVRKSRLLRQPEYEL